MTVNQLPSIPMFWDCNHFVGNVGIQNIFARMRYQVVLQNNHFADNTRHIKAIRLESSITWLNHFKQYFQMSLSNILINIWQNSKYVPLSCPNIIKFYNNGMECVDIMDQKATVYRLDLKSKYHFYLSRFFDLMDITHVNSNCLHEAWWWHIVTEIQNCCSKSFDW